MIGSREPDLDLGIGAVSRFEDIGNVVAFPLDDIETADSDILKVIVVNSRHRAERLVRHDYAHILIEKQNGHRVFLHDCLGTLL